MDDFYNDGNENMRENETPDSVYSYNFREGNSTVHEGDYDERRNSEGTYSYQNASQKQAYSYYEGPQNQNGGQYHQEPKRRKRERRRSGRTSSHGFGIKIVKCAVLAAVFGLVAGGIFRGVSGIPAEKNDIASEPVNIPSSLETTAVSTGETNEESLIVSDVSEIVEQVMPSIVAITNMSQTEYYNFFGQSQVYDSESCGSGIIVSDDDEYLYIATNNHVVSDAQTLTICFVDETTVAAEIKGTDASADLAVVSVKKADLEQTTLAKIKVAALGDSSHLKVGQSAIAIGNALGYGQSVTTGVISALEREVTTTDTMTGDTTTNELVQTDAAINPGNSGGALLNIKGEVIGINSVKYSDTDVEGMGYAIPIDTAKPIIDELITRQVVDEAESAFIGITGVDVTSDVSQAYDMPEGVYIAQISPGSAAEKAGILKGDILVSFDGHEIDSMASLEEQLQYYSAGTTVDVVVKRANNGEYEDKTISVTLGSKK